MTLNRFKSKHVILNKLLPATQKNMNLTEDVCDTGRVTIKFLGNCFY